MSSPPTSMHKRKPSSSSSQADDFQSKKLKTAGTPEEATDGGKSSSTPLPFYGEGSCARCSKRAYYQLRDQALCGRHASKKDTERRKLPVNPDAGANKKAAYQLHLQTIETAAAQNKSLGRLGAVGGYKMRMMAAVPLQSNWLCVFPNYKHQNRTDGYGCRALSPKALPSLPGGALNLENDHQHSKIFPWFASPAAAAVDVPSISKAVRAIECEWRDAKDPAACAADCNKRLETLLAQLPAPSADYDRLRKGMAADPIPYRHQHEYVKKHMDDYKNVKLPEERVNAPLYFVWRDGKRYSYVQSRQFYCQIYERSATQTEEFKYLMKEKQRGVQLLICGYDAYPVDTQKHSLDWHYLDPTRPFGHELVLLTLLTVVDPKHYPWNKFRTTVLP